VTAAAGNGTLQLVLVRHAETEWSRDGRHTGRTDIPLTDAGRAAAAGLPERLRNWSFARVLVSPSTRARETCELAGLGGGAEVRESLLEWDYGEFEGLTTREIRATRPDWYQWRDGCPGGEDAAAVGARADAVLAELSGTDGTVAIFSHGHTLRVLGARWIALDPRDGGRLGLSTSAICVLSHEHGTPILARWNDAGASAPASGRATGGRRGCEDRSPGSGTTF
jgi:broad specificity phosphatase PhoE